MSDRRRVFVRQIVNSVFGVIEVDEIKTQQLLKRRNEGNSHKIQRLTEHDREEEDLVLLRQPALCLLAHELKQAGVLVLAP